MKVTLDYDYKGTGAISIRVIESNDIKFEFVQYNENPIKLVTSVNDLRNILFIRFDDKEILLNIQENFYNIGEIESVIEKIKNKLLSPNKEENIRIGVVKDILGEDTIASIE